MNEPFDLTEPSAQRTIRDLARRDIVELQEIDRRAHGEGWSHRVFIDDIELDDRIHLVVESGNCIVGHAAARLNGSVCRVTNVAIANGSTGQGHASALLVGIINQALLNPKVSNLQLEVRPTNRRAQRLYGRFGFVPVGIERDFYESGDALGNNDALVMAVADVCSDEWRARLTELDLTITTEATV